MLLYIDLTLCGKHPGTLTIYMSVNNLSKERVERAGRFLMSMQPWQRRNKAVQIYTVVNRADWTFTNGEAKEDHARAGAEVG